MPEIEQSQCVLIFGRKGTGKTTLMLKVLKKIRGKKPILIVDLLDKFEKISDYTANSALEFNDLLDKYHSENAVIRLVTTNQIPIIMAMMKSYYRGNVVICMDEADLVFKTRSNDYLNEIILRGRNQGIDFLLSSLRPNRLNIEIRNQADLIFCFGFKNKQTLISLVQQFGYDELFVIINQLQGHEYIKFDVAKSEFEIYQKRKKNVGGARPGAGRPKGSKTKKKKVPA